MLHYLVLETAGIIVMQFCMRVEILLMREFCDTNNHDHGFGCSVLCLGQYREKGQYFPEGVSVLNEFLFLFTCN